MSEITAAANLAAPEGLTYVVYPGWPDDDQAIPVDTVSTAAGVLPARFEVVYSFDDLRGDLSIEWAIEGESKRLRLVRATILGDSDATDLLIAIRKLQKSWRPDDEWRNATVRWLVATAKNVTTIRRYQREGRKIAEGEAYIRSDAEEAALRAALAATSDISTVPRRDRITDPLLRDVAAIYREAHAAGRRPTQAVAQHFGKPRSTAGRWVGLARQAGYLGPANGPRAGEVAEPGDDE